MEEWKRFASVLNPTVKRPERTQAELREAREMTLTYKKRCMQRERTMRKNETRWIKLKGMAINELPEHLRAACLKIDTSPMPKHFIFARWDPPLEGENIFGAAQRPGYKPSVGERGVKPYPLKPKKYF